MSVIIPTEPYAFCSGEEWEKRVPVSQNVSKGKPWAACMRTTHIEYLQPLLGYTLWSELQAAWKANEQSQTPLTDEQAALLFHVRDVEAWRIQFLFLKHNHSPTRETGTVNLSGQGTATADIREVAVKVREAEQFSESREAALRKFLCDNATSYPAWENATDNTPDAVQANGFFVVDVTEHGLPGHHRGRRRD